MKPPPSSVNKEYPALGLRNTRQSLLSFFVSVGSDISALLLFFSMLV
jgi:hypothetical protein